MTATSHTPVMIDEVLSILEPRAGASYVDGTFGGGGYSRALLEAADCSVWGLDRDPTAIENGHCLAQEFPGRLMLFCGRFGNVLKALSKVGVSQLDGFALDLGLSSMQIEDPSRGFSFRQDGPLDMQMGSSNEYAASVVNRLAEQELADIIYKYGEERASRRIARAIVNLRKRTPIERTSQLADLVRSVVNKSRDGIDPATRTFQALRIYVNDELGELERGLSAAEALLAPGGRLVVVSFHSLEDRRVKEFFRARSGAVSRPSRHYPMQDLVSQAPTFRLLERSAIRPKREEIFFNPRARSARLRWAERMGVST